MDWGLASRMEEVKRKRWGFIRSLKDEGSVDQPTAGGEAWGKGGWSLCPVFLGMIEENQMVSLAT